MVASTRTFKAAALVLALLFGVTLCQGVGAEPQPTSLPMSIRVKWQRDDCFSGGGRTFAEHDTYDANGTLVTAKTVCHGGSQDGRTCTNTETTFECTTAWVPRQPRVDVPTGGVLQH